MNTKALEHRRKIKAKKPRFLRQDAHKRAKFRPASYRRPKGLHSKMRLGLKSYAQKIETGYRSPVEARGLHKDGLAPVIVATVAELDALSKAQGAIILSTLGAKKREALLQRAKEKKIPVLNLKVDETLQRLSAARAAKKREQTAKLTEKQKREAEKKKSIEERVEKKDEASTDEEKEQAFEEEKQKVLTKRS